MMKHLVAGVDATMPTTLELLILAALVAAGLFTASQWQGYTSSGGLSHPAR
ncbi:MAG: hypothetical protein ACXVDA_15365 [Ktedonobacterales bacterium]